MTDFVINVVIDPSRARQGSARVRRELGGLENAADRLRRTLGRALAFAGVGVGVGQLIQLADSFTSLQNRIRTVTDSTEQLASTTNELFQIANRTRAPVAQIAELFQRGSIAADELGASQQELFTFVEAVGNGLAIQGGSAAAAAGALTQLSQSLGSGIVRAEEFNSILEGAFPIAQAAARGLDEAGGSVARLRQLIVEGEVTSDEFFRAILSQSDELAETFGSTTVTIGQAFTLLQNRFTELIGAFSSSTGVADAFAQAIVFLGENLETVARFAAAAGIALGIQFAVRGVGAATLAVRALTVAIAANPIGLLVTAVTSAIGLLVAFSDRIALGRDRLVEIGDIAAVAFDRINTGIASVVNFFTENFPALGRVADGVFTDIDGGFQFLVEAAAAAIDSIIGLFTGGFAAIQNAAQNFAARTGGVLANVLNNTVGRVTGLEFQARFGETGESAAQAFADGFNGSTGASDAVDRFFADVERRAQDRAADQALIDLANPAGLETPVSPTRPVIPGGTTGGGGASAQNEALERLRDLQREITGDVEGLLQRQADLNTLYQNGAISAEQFAAAQRSLNVELSASDNTLSGGLRNGIDRIIERSNELGSNISDFVVGAFDQATDAIVNFARTGEINIRDLFGTLAAQLLQIATNQLFSQLLGGLFGGAGGGLFGGGGGFLSGLLGFQNGGSFQVGGSGGADSQLVAFRATPGEMVNVQTPGQQNSGGDTVVVPQPPPNVVVQIGDEDIARVISGSAGQRAIVQGIEKRRKDVNAVLAR